MARHAPRSPSAVRALEVALALFLAALPAAGEEPPPPPDHLKFVFSGAVGYGQATGSAADFLDDTWSADFNVSLEKGRFRGGIGIELHRFKTLEPVPYPEVSAIPFYLHGTFSPWPRSRVRPYLQARLGLTRLHDQVTLDRAGPAASGWSYGFVPGVEIDIDRSVALDLSLGYLGQQADALPLGAGAEAGSLNAFTARAGLTWRPFGRAGLRGYSGPVLPWGVRRSPGLAAAELLVDLTIATFQNEYFHDSDYVQVSPRTWWRNLERGFEIDANKFDTNNFYHPWNGALFYSAGRSTGLGFWGSSATALAGSFLWECCGETLKMSANDVITTTLGGVAMGEALHRLGSVILDNDDRGVSRVVREASIFPLDIVRGVNRLLVHDQYRAPNPEEPLDWRPRRLGALVSLGARRVGNEGDLGGEGAKTAPFVDLFVAYGSVFDNERRRPYDSFWMQTQLNFTDDVDPAGLMTIRGDVLSKPLGEPGPGRGALALVQYFDYVNQRTWEFGAQSLALGYSRRIAFSPSTRLELHADLLGTVLGSINSKFEFSTPPEDPKAVRRWEYGPGLGARAEALLLVGKHPVVQATYRYQWIHAMNDTPLNGGSADHDLQVASVRLRAPLARGFGVGVDGDLFLRKSHYGNPRLVENDDRVPQVRAYVTWRLGAF
jgi:Domain of unknown function (DUF3943)